ncbi:MAG: CPBP family glutamic-type intramembrane protease [Pseudomonadota bacterium]
MSPASRPLRGIGEIALIAAMVEYGMWGLGPQLRDQPHLILVYWLLVLGGAFYMVWLSPIIINRDPPDLRGWAWPRQRRDDPGSWKKAWRSYLALTMAIAALLTLGSMVFRPGVIAAVDPKTFALRLAGYIVFGPVQALLFFGFFQTRLRTILAVGRGPRAIMRHQMMVAAGTATIFSLIHAPNLPLMLFTFFAGLAWSCLFYRRPNILLLGLSHAFLGTVLHQFLLLYMRIGPFYNNPEARIFRVVIPGLAELIGKRF